MSRVAFKMHQRNPNPRGGCACSPHSKVVDCKPPYFVATHAELMDVRQPYVVICLDCIDGCRRKARHKDPLAPPAAVKAQPVEPAEVSNALAAATQRELMDALATKVGP